MKKRYILGILGLASLALASCGNEEIETDDITKERLLTKSVYVSNEKTSNVTEYTSLKLLFKANSEVPYVGIKNGVSFVSGIRRETGKNKEYKVEYNGNVAKVTNELNGDLTLDYDNQLITSSNFELFGEISMSNEPLLLMSNATSSVKLQSSSYKPGNKATFDLKKYSALDIYKANDELYIPLSVFNNLFINGNLSANLIYNFKDLYFMAQDEYTVDSQLGTYLSVIGKKFNSGPKKDSLTPDFAKYYYQSLVFDFDNFYGLKEHKNISFDDFFTEKGYKDDMLSGDPIKMDAAINYAVTYLNDYHTAFAKTSCLYDSKKFVSEKSKYNPDFLKFQEDDEALNNKCKEAGISSGYTQVGDTMFVKFNKFTALDEKALYKESWTSSEISSDTAVLFASLYQDLKSDEVKNTCKNIVVDLTNNDGGSASTLIYALSVLIGNVKMIQRNAISGGINEQEYKCDIKRDKVINDEDICAYDLGYNIYFLDSKYSFSCGNAMPIFAKYSQPNVKILGEKTSGGACAAKDSFTAIGGYYSKSSVTQLCTKKDDSYLLVENGIEADYQISEDKFYDRQYIVDQLKAIIK